MLPREKKIKNQSKHDVFGKEIKLDTMGKKLIRVAMIAKTNMAAHPKTK